MKLGVLLMLQLDQAYGEDRVMEALRAIGQDRNFMNYPLQTDRVDNRQTRLPGL